MKSIFSKDALDEIKERIGHLEPEIQPKWGKMDAAQMLHHCQKAFEIPLGISTIKAPNPLMKLAFRLFRPSLYNDKPWKPNMPTAREFVVRSDKDFQVEKTRLLELADDFQAKGPDHQWPTHPAFGRLKSEQWGKMQYKHLDHHLRQFGV